MVCGIERFSFFLIVLFYLVDFSAMVLTSNSWPFTAPPSFNLPIEVREITKKQGIIVFCLLNILLYDLVEKKV